MSAPIETTNTTTAPVNAEPQPHQEIPATVSTQEHAIDNPSVVPNTAAASTASPAKVAPIERINAAFNKAKTSFNEILADAQKIVDEKKTTTANTGATTTVTAVDQTHAVPNNDQGGKKVGLHNGNWKDILNRAKGLLSTPTTHPATQEQPTVAATNEDVGETNAPIPPPKDNVKPTTTQHNSGSPVVDQLKRNATLLATFILQKKKEYTEKKSSDNNAHQHQAATSSTTTPELHSETVASHTTAPTATTTASKPSSSPLIRRVTHLVNNATASINKRRDTKRANATTTTATATTTTTSSNNISTTAPTTAVVEEAPAATGNSNGISN